tara:strand:- start:139 stop:735 length:597 start_codon:yes stop_codon:yes gene_type:complete
LWLNNPRVEAEMFAVIKTGGKQYKVSENDEVIVEKILGEPGAIIKLEEVLLIGETGKSPTVGDPLVENAGVFAEVLDQAKSKKIKIFKKKRRQNYRRTLGHRQQQTVLKILEVSPLGTRSNKKADKKKSPVKAGTEMTAESQSDKKPVASKKKPTVKKDVADKGSKTALKASGSVKPGPKAKKSAKNKTMSKDTVEKE